MIEMILYSLGAVLAVLAVLAGALAAFRLIPKPPPRQDELAAHARIDALEMAFAGFADQYELSFVRNNAKLGKLRKALARERGEEEEEEEPQREVQNPAPHVQLVGKDELRRRANLTDGGQS